MAVPLVVALLIGAAIAVQAAILGGLAEDVHPLATSLSLMVSGVLVGGLWAAFVRGALPAVATLARQHWWWLPLGAAGWFIVGGLGWTVSRLGAAGALSAVIAAQLTVALALDRNSGGAVLDWRSVVGVALLVGGAALLNATR